MRMTSSHTNAISPNDNLTSTSQEPLLLCLDYDLTLTPTHLFKYTAELIHAGFGRDDALMRAIQLIERQGPRGGPRFWDELYAWLSAGHGLVITSFTAFPELPIASLARGTGELRQRGASRAVTRWLSRPKIIYGDPAPDMNPARPLPGAWLVSPPAHALIEVDQPSTCNVTDLGVTKDQRDSLRLRGKNLHISKALEVFKDEGINYRGVVLMDDDPYNTRLAGQHGHLTISVSRDLDDHRHLDEWRAIRVDAES